MSHWMLIEIDKIESDPDAIASLRNIAKSSRAMFGSVGFKAAGCD
jgi:hypothetical protein